MKPKNFPLKKNLRKKQAVSNLNKALLVTEDASKKARIQKAINNTIIEDDNYCRGRRTKKKRFV